MLGNTHSGPSSRDSNSVGLRRIQNSVIKNSLVSLTINQPWKPLLDYKVLLYIIFHLFLPAHEETVNFLSRCGSNMVNYLFQVGEWQNQAPSPCLQTCFSSCPASLRWLLTQLCSPGLASKEQLSAGLKSERIGGSWGKLGTFRKWNIDPAWPCRRQGCHLPLGALCSPQASSCAPNHPSAQFRENSQPPRQKPLTTGLANQ